MENGNAQSTQIFSTAAAPNLSTAKQAAGELDNIINFWQQLPIGHVIQEFTAFSIFRDAFFFGFQTTLQD